MFYPREAT